MDSSFLKEFYSSISLSPEDFNLLLTAHTKMAVSKNQAVRIGGSMNNSVFVVRSGAFRSYVIDSSGNEVTIGFYQNGDLLADIGSFLKRSSSEENIVALNDGVIYEVGFLSFLNLFNTIEAYRQWGLMWAAEEFIRLKNQSIQFHSIDAKERYTKILRDKPEAVKHARLKHIASYLGITDTSLSRIRRELSNSR